MSLQEYITQKKELYRYFLEFIENEEQSADFTKLFKLFEEQKISENPNNLRLLLHLIAQVSKNYHRSPIFNDKIEKILIHFEDEIKQTFTNLEIYEIFKRSKLNLLFLIEKKIMTIDQSIANLIVAGKPNEKKEKKIKKFSSLDRLIDMKDDKNSDDEPKKSGLTNLYYYFYPEIKEFLNEEKRQEIESELFQMDSEIFEAFDEKRRKGENNSPISRLIRNDLVEEFISYITSNKISPSSILHPSIFETNPILTKYDTSLIEYAAFYGSIQIVQFLEKNNVALNPTLWLFAIHSKNPQMIHFLEDNHVKPPNNSFLNCLKEAIKCHHNDFANYIDENLINQKENRDKFIFGCGFNYYNFAYIQPNYKEFEYFINSCKFDYVEIVEFFLNKNKFNVNEIIQYFIFYKITINII